MPLVLVGYSRAVPDVSLERVIEVLSRQVAEQLDCPEDRVKSQDVVVWPIPLGKLGVQYSDLGILILTGSYPSRKKRLAEAKEQIGRAIHCATPNLGSFVWIHPVDEAEYGFFPAVR